MNIQCAELGHFQGSLWQELTEGGHDEAIGS
jgi:hypothetical protein